MSYRGIRFVERWQRLENLGQAGVVFLMLMFIGIGFFIIAFEPVFDPDVCYRRSSRGRPACDTGSMLFALAIAVGFTFIALRVVFNIFIEFCRPLQHRTLSPILRAFLLLKRMRLHRVLISDSLELSFVTLDENFQCYRAFTLKIEGIHRFTFYEGDNIDITPNCIFREGATLVFYHLADSTGLEYARIKVLCQYHDKDYCFSGQLELETASYELRMMPKQRV